MNYQLKSISKQESPRLSPKLSCTGYLNEPEDRIHRRDIIAVEPQQQLALRLLGLSITDQFTGAVSTAAAKPRKPFSA